MSASTRARGNLPRRSRLGRRVAPRRARRFRTCLDRGARARRQDLGRCKGAAESQSPEERNTHDKSNKGRHTDTAEADPTEVDPTELHPSEVVTRWTDGGGVGVPRLHRRRGSARDPMIPLAGQFKVILPAGRGGRPMLGWLPSPRRQPPRWRIRPTGRYAESDGYLWHVFVPRRGSSRGEALCSISPDRCHSSRTGRAMTGQVFASTGAWGD
jgi:hypothetical protein